MKRITRMTAFVLTMALVLCSFVMPASAATTESKWYLGGGTTLVSETNEIWVVDTITATMPGVNGYFQHVEQMTELVGKDGKDGKGYVNVVVEDGTAAKNQEYGYFKVMLVGKSDPAQAIDRGTGTDKAVIWAVRGDGSNASGQVANAAQNSATAYGKHDDIVAAGGYRFAFSRNADNKAMIRAIGNGAYSDAIKFAKNKLSDKALTEIAGDDGATAADGVYLRIHTGCGSATLTVTVTVAYPMPEDFDVTQPAASRWAMGGGSTVVSATTEYMAVDTAVVSMPATTGYIQHKEQLTDLIGKDGKDGEGFVNIIIGDGTTATSATCYTAMMLVGKADASIAIPNNTVNNQSLTWYLRPDGDGIAQTQGRIANTVANAACEYGAWNDFGAEGFRMAFTRTADETVLVRGIGNGIFYDASQYSKNVKLTTKLTDIEGDNGETAADGVYFRLHTRRSSAPLDATVTIAYPCEAPVVEKPTEPAGLTLSVEKLTFTEGEDIVINFENYNVAADHDVEIRLVKGHGRTDAEMKALEYRYDYTDLSDNYSSGTKQDTSMAITESGTRAFPTDGYAGTAVVAGKYSIAAYDYNDGAKQVSNLIEITVVEASAEPSETPSETPSATPGQTPNQPTGDGSIAMIAVAMVLCAGAMIVFYKKRACKD